MVPGRYNLLPSRGGTERQRVCVLSPWLQHSTHHPEAEQGSDDCRQGSIGYDTFSMNEIAS